MRTRTSAGHCDATSSASSAPGASDAQAPAQLLDGDVDESDGAVDRRGSHERPVRRAQHDRHEFIAVLDLTDQDELVPEGFEWVDERYEVRLLCRIAPADDRC